MNSSDSIEWKELLEVNSLSEARIVQSLLESASIRARLEYDATSSVILGPGSVNLWSKVTVFVSENDWEGAQELLAAIEVPEEEEEEGDV